MTIQIEVEEDVQELLRQRIESGTFRDASDMFAHLVRMAADIRPSPTKTGLTGADLIGALQACPYPELELAVPKRKSLAQLFAESPFKDLDIEFPRDREPMRSVDL